MSLLRSNELDAAMAVLMVIPIHKSGNPLAGFFFAAGRPIGVIRPVYNGTKQRFQVGIVV
jgi:hypothetical protein